jgi:hypothetical protein
MSISTPQAISTLENVLFESPTLASPNVAECTLSSYANVDVFAQALTGTPECSIAG